MAEPLKNLFSQEKLLALSTVLSKHHKSFDSKKFLASFRTNSWRDAELKARIRLVTLALQDTLPADYHKAIPILIKASKQTADGFFSIIFPDYVEVFGLGNWDLSMEALGEFTQSSTAEFAIRPFIQKDPRKAMRQMNEWSKSKNVHQRRLSSEGCRPRLPWGVKLNVFIENPSPVLEVLENLKEDSELYVRKSVANNLNDISKDHPELVLQIAKRWLGKNEYTDWIVQHGLRTLLKKGNKEALRLFGHHNADGWKISSLKLKEDSLRIGDELHFSFQLKNNMQKAGKCRLEYAIDYVKSNKSLSRKVFQISKKTYEPGNYAVQRKQRLQDFTTRKHYPGKHFLHVLVNGEVMATEAFQLR